MHFGGDRIGAAVDFGSFDPTCEQVLAAVEKTARKVPAGTVISDDIGPQVFFDPGCKPASLDRVAPDRPVRLGMWTSYAGMMNRAAAKQSGVRADDPPPLARWYGKDMKSKRWDGVAHQSAWYPVLEKAFDGPGDEPKLRKASEAEARFGVTSITLLELDPSVRLAQLAAIDSPLRVRVVPFLRYQVGQQRHKPDFPPVPRQIAGRVSVRGEKWLLDGTPLERSAAMREPYSDDPSNSGQLDFPPDQPRAILREAQQRKAPVGSGLGAGGGCALNTAMESWWT